MQTALKALISPSGVRMTRHGLPPKLKGGGQWPSASVFNSLTLKGATTSSAPEFVVARGRRKRRDRIEDGRHRRRHTHLKGVQKPVASRDGNRCFRHGRL